MTPEEFKRVTELCSRLVDEVERMKDENARLRTALVKSHCTLSYLSWARLHEAHLKSLYSQIQYNEEVMKDLGISVVRVQDALGGGG